MEEYFGKVIISFGNWTVTEECIFWNKPKEFPYQIIKERLWELRLDHENNKFDWPLHIISKSWVTEKDVHDFNMAFIFALDYFEDYELQNSKGSIWRTLISQQEIIKGNKYLRELLEEHKVSF